MTPDAKKKLIGAIVAAALAVAVYYGLIDQKQADSIKTQTDQTLGTGPAEQPPPTSQQPAPQQGPATTQNSTTPAPPPPASPPPSAPQNEVPSPQR